MKYYLQLTWFIFVLVGCGGTTNKPCNSKKRSILIFPSSLSLDTSLYYISEGCDINKVLDWKFEGCPQVSYTCGYDYDIFTSGPDGNIHELWSINSKCGLVSDSACLYPNSDSLLAFMMREKRTGCSASDTLSDSANVIEKLSKVSDLKDFLGHDKLDFVERFEIPSSKGFQLAMKRQCVDGECDMHPCQNIGGGKNMCTTVDRFELDQLQVNGYMGEFYRMGIPVTTYWVGTEEGKRRCREGAFVK